MSNTSSYRGNQYENEYIFPHPIHKKIFHYLKFNIYMDLIFFGCTPHDNVINTISFAIRNSEPIPIRK